MTLPPSLPFDAWDNYLKGQSSDSETSDSEDGTSESSQKAALFSMASPSMNLSQLESNLEKVLNAVNTVSNALSTSTSGNLKEKIDNIEGLATLKGLAAQGEGTLLGKLDDIVSELRSYPSQITADLSEAFVRLLTTLPEPFQTMLDYLLRLLRDIAPTQEDFPPYYLIGEKYYIDVDGDSSSFQPYTPQLNPSGDGSDWQPYQALSNFAENNPSDFQRFTIRPPGELPGSSLPGSIVDIASDAKAQEWAQKNMIGQVIRDIREAANKLKELQPVKDLPGEIKTELEKSIPEDIKIKVQKILGDLNSIPSPEEWPKHIAARTVEASAKAVSSIVQTFLGELRSLQDPQSLFDDSQSGILSKSLKGSLFGDSSIFSNSLLTAFKNANFLKPGWAGPLLGFEFGFFDVGEGGAKAIRLTPFSYGTSPLSGALILFNSATASIALGTEATKMLLYSLFPGHPSLLDIPVLTGQLSVNLLPPKLSSQPQAGDILCPLSPGWPGSGYFPTPGITWDLPDKGNIEIKISRNVLDVDTAANLISTGNLGDYASLQNIGMRVIRPISHDLFTDRFQQPLPTIICDEIHGRIYLFRYEKVSQVQSSWKVIALYHPLTTQLNRALERKGVEGIYEIATPESEKVIWEESNKFADSFTVDSEKPILGECLDLAATGAYSPYNWEVLFHIPILIGNRFATRQKFKQALQWYRKVFDPTFVEGDAPQRYWRFQAFYSQNQEIESVIDWLTQLSEGSLPEDKEKKETPAQKARETLIQRWQQDPLASIIVSATKGPAVEARD